MSKSAIPVFTKLRRSVSLSLTEMYLNGNARQTILKTKQQRAVTARFGSCVSTLRSAEKGKRGILQFPPKLSTMAPIIKQGIHKKIDGIIQSHRVVIFSKSFCPFCRRVKELFDSMNQEYYAVELDLIEDGSDIQDALAIKTNQKTVPNVFISGEHIGGSDKTLEAHSSGRLQLLLTKTAESSKTGSSSVKGNGIEESHLFDYDLIVIGGGSGGLAAAKEAAVLGKKVAVCDFVKPSPRGTTWGLGGTCVNVGCIPKKLMHQAALLGQGVEDAKSYGWEIPDNVHHNWNAMVEAIQNHIGSLNWGYRVALREKRIDYINAFAEFIDNHTIKTADKHGRVKTITADHIVLAMGGRPLYPKIPGAREHCITSDDLFSLPYCPGKTLLVGASYIALECAGFLAGLGLDTTVMVRSILLRGFDQQMAELIGSRMEGYRVKFLRGFVPVTVEKIKEGTPGLLKVTSQASDGQIVEEEYNTVILAIGREACTKNIGIEKTGVKLNPMNGKVICDSGEQSSVENIYAIGDILDGRLELTPVAIQAGRLLAQRLYGGTQLLTDYINVPTTVFTPVEYGAVGLSEEDAIARHGADNIEVYHSYFTPLEFVLPKRGDNSGYAKLICLKPSKKVIGFHVLSPNAGEITQGFAVGLKLGATKADFDNLIGIHPTVAEVFTTLQFTKASGSDVLQKGC